MKLIQKAAELTPIEEYDGVLYKRDDLFRPFPDEELNGGKVRQAINLIYQNLDLIRIGIPSIRLQQHVE